MRFLWRSAGEFIVISDVVRAHRRTRSPSLRAITRYPSNLISCSQPGPDGGLSASAGWHGRMKPSGLERDRIGRETRQSILAGHLNGRGSDCESLVVALGLSNP